MFPAVSSIEVCKSLLYTTFLKHNFICLFLAILGLCCCTSFSVVALSSGSSSLQRAGFSLRWLLVAEHTGMWASVVEAHGLISCRARA